MVETNDSNDVTPVDRAQTLTASAPQPSSGRTSRYRVNRQSKSGHSNFNHGDIWRMDPKSTSRSVRHHAGAPSSAHMTYMYTHSTVTCQSGIHYATSIPPPYQSEGASSIEHAQVMRRMTNIVPKMQGISYMDYSAHHVRYRCRIIAVSLE